VPASRYNAPRDLFQDLLQGKRLGDLRGGTELPAAPQLEREDAEDGGLVVDDQHARRHRSSIEAHEEGIARGKR
jgi:hypothetical protein